MKRFASVLVAGMTLGALPAWAAAPTAFMAQGSAVSFATPSTPEQSSPIKFYYAGGKVRLEMAPTGGQPAIVLARRGAKTVTLLDPQQKVAFVAPAQSLDEDTGMPSVDHLLDIPNWKQELVDGSKQLPGTEVIGTERCTLWVKTKGRHSFKVWMSQSLDLPMQMEGSTDGKPRFRFTMTRVTPGPQASGLFVVPAGYQTTEIDQGLQSPIK